MDTAQPTNQAYETPQPPMQSSSLSGKRLFIGLAIVIIILLVVLSLITGKKEDNQKQTNNAPTSSIDEPTSNPTTPVSSKGLYVNDTYGFEFKYPPQFTAKHESSDVISVMASNTPRIPDAPATGLQVSITKGDNTTTNLDLAKNLFQTPVIKNIVINDVPAKELSGNGKGMLDGKFIKFVEIYKNGQTIEFSYFEGDPGFTQEVLNNILTSFKFTK